ncbi:MAG: helix-turn-helix domain-containing protein [Cyanobacteria bacterium J06621_11]
MATDSTRTDAVVIDTATVTLKVLMQAVDITSYRALAERANVSRWQIQQLRTGNLEKMRVAVLSQIAAVLEMDCVGLIQAFQLEDTGLQAEEAQVKEAQSGAVQTAALQTLETWLTQWPTIAKRAREKGDALAAAKILPFVRPVEQLMQEWNVEPIATIDAQIPYDPQYHQLTEGMANPGDTVRVTHVGQRHNGKLLHRVKVKPIV